MVMVLSRGRINWLTMRTESDAASFSTSSSTVSGQDADISVLELVEGRWALADVEGQSRTGAQALIPVVTIKGGEVVEPGEPPHAWGWTPPSVNGGAA